MERVIFDNIVKEVCSFDHTYHAGTIRYWSHGAKSDDNRGIQIEWITGGITGGNCWGDSANYPVSADPEPDFTVLVTLLERLAPSMTVFQYFRIMGKVIKTDSRYVHEYYGNSTEYAIKRVEFDTLYDELKAEGFL